MIAGMYLNDKRVGEWTSFAYSGDAFQKFDFSKQKLIFDRSMKDTLEYNKNRRSLFIGGLPCLMEFLSREFQLAGNIIKTERDSISVIVSFTIDKKGNLLDPKVEKSHGHKPLDDEAVRVTSRTNNHWIPAISDSKTIDSIYKIQFYIIRKNTSFTQKAFTINYKPIFE